MAQQSFKVGAQINQNDLLAIQALVLSDSVARRKWPIVVDLMVFSAWDTLRIRYLWDDHEYEEAVRHSLEIFRDKGGDLYKLLSVLRDVGLKDLADKIERHTFGLVKDMKGTQIPKPKDVLRSGEVATKESKVWLGTTDLTHPKKLKPVQESSVPPTFVPLGSSKGIQGILLKMTRLVVGDPVAIRQWSIVVEDIVEAKSDKLQIKRLLKEYAFEEAALSSLRIWHAYGTGRPELLQILRDHGLNSLADKLRDHVASLDLEVTTRIFPIWFGVGKVVHNFTGRQAELDSLHKMLNPTRDTFLSYVGAVCISGLGGIGKTSLATAYAHTYKNVYDGGVIWVEAESEYSIRASFTKLLKQHFGITLDMKTTTRQIAEMVHNHLRHKKVLMIFDNMVDPDHIRMLFPLMEDPDNYLLVTSRRTDLMPAMYSHHLDGLSSQDANKLILSQLSTVSAASATMLADKLERFPLAIQQAITYIKHRASLCLDDNQGVVECIEEFDRNAKRLLDGFLSTSDYALTTFSTWKPTLAQIEHENGGSQAIQVLNVLSYLNPENISVEFLQLLLRSVPKASSNWARLMAFFNGEDDHFREEDVYECLHILQKFSMINLSSGKIGIHRLVQKVITLNLNAKEVKVIRAILDFLWIEFQKEQLTDHLRECVFHGLHLFQFQVRHRELMQERSKYLAKLCFYLNEYGNYAQSAMVAQEASSIFERMHGKNHESTIRLKLKLGEANARLHTFEEALKILDEILPISRSVLGEAHSLTLDILSALGRLTEIKEIEAQVAAAAVEVASDTGTTPAQNIPATSALESTPKRIIWKHPPLDSVEESSEGNEKIKSPGIWFDVGEVRHNFVGRKEEVARLHKMIVESHSNQSSMLNIVNICGMPGIGKSELARKYAAEYSGFYEGNVILINGENREEMRKSFSKLLASLRQPVRYGETDEDLACRAFEQFSNRCCLFIFDNVEGKEDLQAFRPRIEDPGQYTPYILVTSRWTDCTPLAKNTLRLGVLSLDESVLLIKRELGLSDSRESKAEAEELAVALGRLPWALQQAAAYIKDTGSDEEAIRSYLHLFNENREGFLSDKTFTGFFAAISTHMSQVSKDEAGKLLVVMAYLHPSRISAQFLSKLFPKQTRRLLSSLEKLSLVSIHDKRIEIHQLVQLVVRLSLDSTEERDIVSHISGQLRVEILCEQDTALARECTLHGLTLFPFQRKHPDLHGKYDYFIALCSKLDLYGNSNDSLELCEECLSSPDLDNESTLIFKLQLVSVHCSMGDFDQAEEVLDKLQPMCQMEKGERRWLSTRAMTLRAKIMSIRGEGEEAIKIMDEVIALRVQEHGSGAPPAVWRSLETQAIALLRLGKLDDAGKVFQSVYDQRLQRFGPEDVETLRTRGFFGEVAFARREYKEALDIFGSVHQAYNMAFGENNRLSAGILHSMALVYSSMGQVQKVLGIYDKIVQLGAKVLGERKLLEYNQERDDAYRQVMKSLTVSARFLKKIPSN